MIVRIEPAKYDLAQSWNRSDRAFFAAGACHILADAFLRRFPASAFHATLICPPEGARGSHVFVSDGTLLFDYHGFSAHDRFVRFYSRHLQRRFPGWQADFVPLSDSPASAEFCRRYHHREPAHFLYDPRPRAEAFLSRLLAKPSSDSAFQRISATLRAVAGPVC